MDSPLKFALACVIVAFMGVATQGLIAARPAVQRRTGGMRIVESLMFGLQVALGWFMMLVAMTFSTELFCSATAGLIFGHFLFADTGSTKVLGTPCCNSVSGGHKAAVGRMVSTLRTPFVESQNAFTAVIRVDGMTCNSCTSTVEAAAAAVEGVLSCSVVLAHKRAEVRFQRPATAEVIVAAIDAVGFDAELAVESKLETELSTSVVASNLATNLG